MGSLFRFLSGVVVGFALVSSAAHGHDSKSKVETKPADPNPSFENKVCLPASLNERISQLFPNKRDEKAAKVAIEKIARSAAGVSHPVAISLIELAEKNNVHPLQIIGELLNPEVGLDDSQVRGLLSFMREIKNPIPEVLRQRFGTILADLKAAKEETQARAAVEKAAAWAESTGLSWGVVRAWLAMPAVSSGFGSMVDKGVDWVSQKKIQDAMYAQLKLSDRPSGLEAETLFSKMSALQSLPLYEMNGVQETKEIAKKIGEVAAKGGFSSALIDWIQQPKTFCFLNGDSGTEKFKTLQAALSEAVARGFSETAKELGIEWTGQVHPKMGSWLLALQGKDKRAAQTAGIKLIEDLLKQGMDYSEIAQMMEHMPGAKLSPGRNRAFRKLVKQIASTDSAAVIDWGKADAAQKVDILQRLSRVAKQKNPQTISKMITALFKKAKEAGVSVSDIERKLSSPAFTIDREQKRAIAQAIALDNIAQKPHGGTELVKTLPSHGGTELVGKKAHGGTELVKTTASSGTTKNALPTAAGATKALADLVARMTMAAAGGGHTNKTEAGSVVDGGNPELTPAEMALLQEAIPTMAFWNNGGKYLEKVKTALEKLNPAEPKPETEAEIGVLMAKYMGTLSAEQRQAAVARAAQDLNVDSKRHKWLAQRIILGAAILGQKSEALEAEKHPAFAVFKKAFDDQWASTKDSNSKFHKWIGQFENMQQDPAAGIDAIRQLQNHYDKNSALVWIAAQAASPNEKSRRTASLFLDALSRNEKGEATGKIAVDHAGAAPTKWVPIDKVVPMVADARKAGQPLRYVPVLNSIDRAIATQPKPEEKKTQGLAVVPTVAPQVSPPPPVRPAFTEKQAHDLISAKVDCTMCHDDAPRMAVTEKNITNVIRAIFDKPKHAMNSFAEDFSAEEAEKLKKWMGEAIGKGLTTGN